MLQLLCLFPLFLAFLSLKPVAHLTEPWVQAVQAVNVLRALGFDTIEDPDAEHAGTLMHRV